MHTLRCGAPAAIFVGPRMLQPIIFGPLATHRLEDFSSTSVYINPCFSTIHIPSAAAAYPAR